MNIVRQQTIDTVIYYVHITQSVTAYFHVKQTNNIAQN